VTKQTNKATVFNSFQSALKWAKTHAREHCHFFHFWRVEHSKRGYVVAIRSKNTNHLDGYAVA